MIARTHQNLCFFITIASFASLCLAYFSHPSLGDKNNVIFTCILGFVLPFFITLRELRKVQDSGLSLGLDEVLGQSNTEKMQILITVWLPLILAIFAVLSLLYFGGKTADFTWILIAIDLSFGSHSARVFYSMKWQDSQ